jgi:SAM-dependent methyltransferase
VCSADDLPFDDGTFDSVSVRFGFMFFPDLPLAAAELVRVLKPGGRLCAAVWIAPDQNPWTTILMQAIATEVELPPPDPNGPNMYRCAAPGAVAELCAQAGLGHIEEWDVPVELVTASPEEYWDVMSEHVSLAAAALQQVDDETRARIRDRAIEAVRQYDQGTQTRVPGLARCTLGTKP